MASPPAKRQRRKPALDIENLLEKLLAVDESSLSELQEFKRALQSHVASHSNSAVSAAVVPTLAASKLSRAEVFKYFDLRNKCTEKWGILTYDIPPFALKAEFQDSCSGPSPWLLNALDRCASVFSRNNESDIRIFVNLIIMDVVHDVQRFQSNGRFNAPRPDASDRPSTPPHARPIHVFTEAHISSTVHVGEKVVRITGRFDIGFGHGLARPTNTLDDSSDSSMLLDTFLAVMETKGIHSDFEAAFNQLLVYLSMVHRARARKLKRDSVETGNSTVYGVLSDGDRFVFLCLDNASIVYRSPDLHIVTQLPQILRYFRHCLSVVATSSLTSSPHNIRVESRAPAAAAAAATAAPQDKHTDIVDDRVEYDFVGLQKRVFHFRTAEYDEEDILTWK